LRRGGHGMDDQRFDQVQMKETDETYQNHQVGSPRISNSKEFRAV
jgi:hypothetical protein